VCFPKIISGCIGDAAQPRSEWRRHDFRDLICACRIANIAPIDAMILSYDANPVTMFSEVTAVHVHVGLPRDIFER
jgi:hypothetical protein